MELTGRVTADAKVSQTPSGKNVTNFTIAVNDRFKTKEGDLREVVSFIKCSYWIAPKVAEVLKKGAIVEISGRISASAFMDRVGEPKASLDCHVNSIKVHQFARKAEAAVIPATEETKVTEPADDLPF